MPAPFTNRPIRCKLLLPVGRAYPQIHRSASSEPACSRNISTREGNAELGFRPPKRRELLTVLAKALLRKIERAVDTPHCVLVPAARPGLGHRRGVNNTDQAAMARLRRAARQRLAYQLRQPISAVTQATQQGHVGDIDKANRRCPCRCQPQTSLAETIRQDQAQQIDRIPDPPRTNKRLRLARANVEGLRPTKLDDNTRPVFVHKRFVCHPNLESQVNPTRKSYFNANGRKPARCCINSNPVLISSNLVLASSALVAHNVSTQSTHI